VEHCRSVERRKTTAWSEDRRGKQLEKGADEQVPGKKEIWERWKKERTVGVRLLGEKKKASDLKLTAQGRILDLVWGSSDGQGGKKYRQ